MSQLEVFLDDTPGEVRGMVVRNGRFDALIIQRESDVPQHRLGTRSTGDIDIVSRKVDVDHVKRLGAC